MFVIDGQPVGLDLFHSSRTLQATLPKLLRGYAIDALDRTMTAAPATERSVTTGASEADVAVREFLTALLQAESKTFPAVGVGESWRFVSPTLSGGALVFNSHLVHVSVFRN